MPVRADQLPEPAAPSPPPGLVTVGRFDQHPGYSVSRPGGADSWLFIWTTGGEGRLAQGAAETDAGARDLVVLGPDVPHHYAVARGARHWAFWWAHCQARPTWTDWLRPYALGDRLYAVTPVPDGVRARLESAFRRMLADARWTGEGPPPEDEPEDGRVAVAHGTTARELALCSLESVVLLATATARGEPNRSGLDVRIRQAEALIAADPGAPHTVESLAAGVSLSASRFAHLFTQQLGRSPMRALLAARLLHAARLLEATDLPVERVAAASGFSSPFHFNRVFRQRYGAPPGAYRAGLRR
ncbi:helix-turn-helix domain-containing protein [Streptomyces sp. NBC_00878]|uniref:helix-turn-helix domain-containing protein n=1 Tax=Streptomyces sp. NBC_00878 TaxID=2975854 RepID=UPI002253CF3E|nr:helix-turn-helix domain-containing protein [Streptomyces sp. NBC_00878]MCX4903150.1 helix-turn-helix domain-containing protein [Streptomyces sp. NBC_00878]